ncbi:MAG: TIR domain-containing protein [Candidatus Thiodiazotropha sp.]
MARKCFYSFHYNPDNWRVSTVRNIGAIEGNKPASDNDWETITKGGEKKIKEWIADQMKGRSCTIILAGSNTANRKWINHEIVKSWDDGKGVLVIHIHNLKDKDGEQSSKGANPLYYITHGPTKKRLSTIAKAYDPPRTTSKGVYSYIEDNIEDWIEEAIQIRKDN